jgi:hypothetical protein
MQLVCCQAPILRTMYWTCFPKIQDAEDMISEPGMSKVRLVIEGSGLPSLWGEEVTGEHPNPQRAEEGAVVKINMRSFEDFGRTIEN